MKDDGEPVKANISAKPRTPHTQSLSFSSSGATAKTATKKRKVIGSAADDEPATKAGGSKPVKKPKKAQKKLLSFGDDT